ncbi:hypothetical protein PISMIDRAFT_23384 [Pisolithus microcarpus 441]|uniref:Uncharacterized protein n=1 Tax=Pisolithus microcarpus 441 TaxID=765257 RepID=A0A0C9Z3G7_9AGAM|nr:hypothetical protein PISMIDRAFT_23384 [Pisolithus microcarpus 441]
MARCSALRVRHIHVGVSCVIGTNMLAIVTLGSGVKNVKGGGKYSGRKSGESWLLANFRIRRTMADGNTIASHVIWNAMAGTPYREDNSLKRHSPNVRANDRSAGERFLRRGNRTHHDERGASQIGEDMTAESESEIV